MPSFLQRTDGAEEMRLVEDFRDDTRLRRREEILDAWEADEPYCLTLPQAYSCLYLLIPGLPTREAHSTAV